MKKEFNPIILLIISILGLISTIIFALFGWIFSIFAIYFGFKNKKNMYSKISIAIGVITLILLIIIIGLRLNLGSPYGLFIYEGCSMHHDSTGFENILKSDIYEQRGISIEDTKNWPFQKGINRGDIIITLPVKEIQVGDLILFSAELRNPIMHRVISTDPISTKGDNYETNSRQLSAEKRILEDQIMGKGVIRIPYVGWLRLMFFEPFRNTPDKGFCE